MSALTEIPFVRRYSPMSPHCQLLVTHTIAFLQHVLGVGLQQLRPLLCRQRQHPLPPPRTHHQLVRQTVTFYSQTMEPTSKTTQHNNDNIQIRVIKPQEYQRVLDFLRIHYYLEEPLTSGSEPKQQDKADEEFNMSNIEHGTCLMAVQQEADRIVGAVLAGPKGPDEAEHLFEAAAEEGPTKWGTVLHFLAGIERDANVCHRYGVERVLHAHVVGVDAQMRGKNISGRLMTDLKALGKSLNYELLTADCTSYYSAKMCERLGWDCVNMVFYKDYLDANGKQIFTPKAPHECCKTFATRL